MAIARNFLAFDLGASSGRAVLGSLADGRIELRELHRFANGPTRLLDGLYWNAPLLFDEIKRGLVIAAAEQVEPAGIGVDTWGVDYGLIGARGELLGLPRHYRDPRTRGAMDAVFARVPREEVYALTGIQFMALNTLFQLWADAHAGDGRTAAARALLFMPSLFTYWLCGERVTDVTIASTSQMLDPERMEWATGLLNRLGLPSWILPDLVSPGTGVGPLLGTVATETGLPRVTVFASAGHDTACAVAAVPASGDDWAYISCGTWSLIGVELERPVRTLDAMAASFTNEVGVSTRRKRIRRSAEGRMNQSDDERDVRPSGNIRFLRNVAGLWLVQECSRVWASQGRTFTYEQLTERAARATPLRAFIDPDAPEFGAFGDMPARIREFCAATRQPPPDSEGDVVRCVLESLALKYRVVVDEAERLIRRPIRTVHIVGGGVQNELLCRLAAHALGRDVIAGPIEATAMGNCLIQAMGAGDIGGARDIRAIALRSSELKRYEPRDQAAWSDALGRFQVLLETAATQHTARQMPDA